MFSGVCPSVLVNIFIYFYVLLISSLHLSANDPQNIKLLCQSSASIVLDDNREPAELLQKLREVYRSIDGNEPSLVRDSFYRSLKKFWERYAEEMNFHSVNDFFKELTSDNSVQKLETIKNPVGEVSVQNQRLLESNVVRGKDFPPWQIRATGDRYIIQRYDKDTKISFSKNFSVIKLRLSRDEKIAAFLVNQAESKSTSLVILEKVSEGIVESRIELGPITDLHEIDASYKHLFFVGRTGKFIFLEKKNGVWDRLNSDFKLSDEYEFVQTQVLFEGLVLVHFSRTTNIDGVKTTVDYKNILVRYSNGDLYVADSKFDVSLEKTQFVAANTHDIFLTGGSEGAALHLGNSGWEVYPVKIRKSLIGMGKSVIGKEVVAIDINTFFSKYSHDHFVFRFDGKKYSSIKKLPTFFYRLLNKKSEYIKTIFVADILGKESLYELSTNKGSINLDLVYSNEQNIMDVRGRKIDSNQIIESLVRGDDLSHENLRLYFEVERLKAFSKFKFQENIIYFFWNNVFYRIDAKDPLKARVSINVKGRLVGSLLGDNLPSFMEAVFFIRDEFDSLRLIEFYKDGEFLLHDIGKSNFSLEAVGERDSSYIQYSERGYRIGSEFYKLDRGTYDNFF